MAASVSENLPIALSHNNDILDDEILGTKYDRFFICCKPRRIMSWCCSIALLVPMGIKFMNTLLKSFNN